MESNRSMSPAGQDDDRLLASAADEENESQAEAPVSASPRPPMPERPAMPERPPVPERLRQEEPERLTPREP
ncbi:MAG: hypothetical protein IT323_07970, partial [Anaerolineae bacterium]|nr:hypothetical protein [Anaerolineae bacterium]